MSRFSRKTRTDVKFKGCGGLTDAFDDMIKQLWRINDEEYDWICEYATDDELDSFLLYDESISGLKNSILIVEKLLTRYKLEESEK